MYKSCIHLAITEEMLPWQPIKVAKSAFFADICYTAIPKRIGILERQWAA